MVSPGPCSRRMKNIIYKIYLVLSFDHELSLGAVNDSYAADLFAPCEQLLDLADSHHVQITLFTDVLSARQFRAWDVPEFYETYESQIRDAIRRGHDVQLHLHPHWLTTTFREGRFYPSHKYSLDDYRNTPYPNDIYGIVEQGVKYLNELCRPIKGDYRCIAFRAGGYALASSADKILAALWSNGVKIDSTIAKGFRFESSLAKVDFSKMPRRANWFIPLSGPLSSCSAKGIFEVPIVTTNRNPLNNLPFLLKRVLYRGRRPRTGEGLHVTHTTLSQKLKRLMPFSAWMLSFDSPCISASNLLDILSKYLSMHSEENVIFASTIAHPKSMNTDNFKILSDFIQLATEKYKDTLEFCSFQDILKKIETHDSSCSAFQKPN